MQTLNFSITINAAVEKVRDTMLEHPTYEQRTTAFSEWSTYTGSREQGADIKFVDPAWYGMLSRIASNRLYEYISIQHLGEIGKDHEIKMYDTWEIFENYSFTKIDAFTTKIDVEMTAMPDERVDMFNEMWPKALDLLKGLCEK